MTRAELKQRAKNVMAQDHWGYVGYLLLAGVIMGALEGIATLVPGIGNVVAALLVVFPLAVGMIRLIMRKRNTGITQLDDLFSAYKTNLGNTIFVLFMQNLFITLWTFVFIIPGIIKSYEYCMVEYILAENPNLNYKDALEMSKKMTDGKKMEIFVLDLSFIGWALLSVISLGIVGVCYFAPYYTLTKLELYYYLKFENFGDTDPLAQNFNGQYTGQFAATFTEPTGYNQQ